MRTQQLSITFPQKKASSKRRTIKNEGGRELKSIFLYG
jgi:hypothetical protein